MRIDLVTHYWPPISAPGTNRLVGWAEAWRDAGHTLRVWTPSADPRDPFYDPTREQPAGIEVRNVPLVDLGARWRRRVVDDGGAPTARPSPARRAALVMRDLLEIPDHRIFWNGRVQRAMADAEASRVLITTSPYNSTHLIGLHWKRRYPDGCWVADFRDPWTQPWRRHFTTAFHRRLALRQERSIAAAADLLTFWDASGISDMERRIGRSVGDRAMGVWNGLAPEVVSELAQLAEAPPVEPFRLVYAGTLWDWRLPEGLLDGWTAFVESVGRPVELVFVGRIEPAALATIRAWQAGSPLANTVVLTAPVPGPDALRLQAQAGALLNLASPTPDTLTSKIFELIASRRPILFVGHPDSPGAVLLRSLGASLSVADGWDPASIRRLFLRFSAAVRAHNLDGWSPKRVPLEIDRTIQARRLLDRIESLTGPKRQV